MTNSEIIRVIISKNPTKRTSSLRKCQILQLAARYGTADDIRAAFQAYGQFEFVSGAFVYVFAYADLEKLDAMLENEATLHTDDDQWSYILYVLQNYDTKSRFMQQFGIKRKELKELGADGNGIASFETFRTYKSRPVCSSATLKEITPKFPH